jgi:hypothetical protein
MKAIAVVPGRPNSVHLAELAKPSLSDVPSGRARAAAARVEGHHLRTDAAYLGGGLPALVRAEFDRHLALGVNCQRYLTSYEQTVTLGKRAFDDADASLPNEVPEDLVRAIIAARRRT